MLMFSVFVMFTVFLSGCNLNRLGTDKYYVQINKDGEQLKEKNVNGDTTYQYKLSGIDKDDKEKGVKSWEEVKKEELPAKVKEKLKVN